MGEGATRALWVSLTARAHLPPYMTPAAPRKYPRLSLGTTYTYAYRWSAECLVLALSCVIIIISRTNGATSDQGFESRARLFPTDAC